MKKPEFTTWIVMCPYCGSEMGEVDNMCCGEVHGEEVEVCESCLYEPEYCECEDDCDGSK